MRPITEFNSGNSYSGSSSYKYVEPLLDKSAELSIVSPYVDLAYMKRLAKLSKRRRVRLIMSKGKVNEQAIRYIRNAKGYISYIKAALFFAALSAISFLIGFYSVMALCTAITATMAILARHSYKKGVPNLVVRFCTSVFVHEKLYIGSERAITGSANLTYKGLHRNIEHIEVTDSPESIEKLRNHFDGLWDSLKPD